MSDKLTLEDVVAWAIADTTFWQDRNARFEEHEKLFQLEEPKDLPAGLQAVVLNDPNTIVEKAANIVSRKSARIEVAPRGEKNTGAAQRIENALRWYEAESNEIRRDGLHNSYDYDLCKSGALRGWISEILMVDREAPMCARERLLEPYHVYPRMSSMGLLRVTHQYQTEACEVKADFPDAEWLQAFDESQLVTVTGIYLNRAPYYHCVTVDGKWAKEPVELEHWPVIMRVVKGAFTHEAIGGTSRQEHARNIGQGFLYGSESVLKNLNRWVTTLTAIAVKTEDPPLVLELVGDTLKEVTTLPGGRSIVALGEKVHEVFNPNAAVGPLMQLTGTYQDRLSKSTFPSAMYGAGTEAASGYLQSLMMGAAQDVLATLVDTVASFKARRFSKVLEIFRDNYPDPKGVDILSRASQVSDRKSGLVKGQHVWGTKLTIKDVKDNGVHVEVVYPEVTPQDRLAIANMVLGLVRERVWSLRRGRMMTEVDDPQAEDEQVIREQMFLNEDVMKEASYAAWREAAQELPTTQAILKIIREEKAREAAAAAQPPAPAMGVDMNGQPPQYLPPAAAGAQPAQPGGPMEIADRLAALGMVPPSG